MSELNSSDALYTDRENSLQITPDFLSKTTIDSCFYSYVPFCKFCHENGIIYISDLKDFDFDQLSSVRGIGPSKITKIRSLYETICSDCQINLKDTSPSYPFQDIDTSCNKLPTAALRHWAIPRKIIRTLTSAGYSTLGDLRPLEVQDLKHLIGKSWTTELCAAATAFQRPLNIVVEGILADFKDSRGFDICSLRSEGLNLNSIGNLYNLSRERIRQIYNKVTASILPYAEVLALYLEDTTGNKYISEELFLNQFVDKELGNVIFSILGESENYDYLDFAEMLVNKDYYPQTEASLCQIMDSVIGDGINFFDSLETIENALATSGFEFITTDHFLNLMIKYNCVFYGDYIFRDRKSYASLAAEIIAEEFPDGITMNDEHLNILRKMITEKYEWLELPDKNRALGARISSKLILRGKSKYISPSHVYIDTAILDNIKDFINSNSQQTLYYKEIFSEFEGLLTMTSNVDNPWFLHGVLAYYYPDEYTYSRDFLMKHSAAENKTVSERIEEIISSAGHALSKKEILSQLPGISETMLLNANISSSNLIVWENNYYNTMDNIAFSEEEIEDLKQILISITGRFNGYCSQELFFQEAESHMHECLFRNNITCAQNLFYISAEWFKDIFDFRNPHIARSGCFSSLETKNIALEFLGNNDILKYSDFTDLAHQLMWSPVTSGAAFEKIEREYIRISKDEYMKADKFILDDSSIEIILQLIESAANGAWYLPLQEFTDIETILPNGIKFNGFLAEAAVNNLDLRWHTVTPISKNRQLLRAILVKNSVDIYSYDKLIAEIMSESEITYLTEPEMLSFLQIHQLARKTIPKELYSSTSFIVTDEGFSLC